MTNPFGLQQQPYLQFLHNDTPQSNSLLGHLMVKQQQSSQQMQIHYMENQRFNSHMEQYQRSQQYNQHYQQNYKRNQFQRSQNYNKFKPKTKQKKKVFYRDKMAQLMNQQSYIKPQYNYVDFAQFQKGIHLFNSYQSFQQTGKSPLSRQQQLKRNRQSAKQSRQRKKQYVETLQQKNKLHQKHINDLTQRLRQTQLQRDRLKQSNNAHVISYLIYQIQSFNKLKSQVYEKLSFMVQSNNKTQQQKNKQIQQNINDLRDKFGSAGKQRVNLVNYYMSQIIENLLTDFQKYFINCAIANTGIFVDNSQQDITKMDLQVAAVLGLNDTKKKNSLVSKYKDRFKKQAVLFNNYCQQLYQSFSYLINQSTILQNIFNDLRKQFQPQQVARLILYFEQNKFRKDLRKMRNEWYDNFRRNENQVTDSIRKITKRFQY